MKKLSILTTPAVALGVAVLCAPQALAASYTLNQTNIDAAAAAFGTQHNGIFCSDTTKDFCTLDEGEWVQDGDINLTTVQIDGTPITGLVLQKNVTITNSDDSTITGNISISGAEVTLNDLNVNGNVKVEDADAEVTINGGNYTGEGGDAALRIDNAKSVEINDANLRAGEASAAYVWTGDITITGNSTFASEKDNGIEFFGLNSLNISGGTFTGAKSGIAFEGAPAAGKVSLTGGTFTGTSANGNAIIVSDTADSTAIVSGMVAAGYHFSNGKIETKTETTYGLGGGTFTYTYIAGTTEVAADGEGEESQNTDPTSTSTTKKSGIKAPDTGVFTTEGGSAKDGSTLAIVAALATVAFGTVLIKKYSKRA